MALKQNFEWFGNNNPALILNSMALVGIGNWVGFLRSGICSRSGFGFSDANKTIHASSLQGLFASPLRELVYMHSLYGTVIYALSLKRTYL
jgi:hypothetical protein